MAPGTLADWRPNTKVPMPHPKRSPPARSARPTTKSGSTRKAKRPRPSAAAKPRPAKAVEPSAKAVEPIAKAVEPIAKAPPATPNPPAPTPAPMEAVAPLWVDPPVLMPPDVVVPSPPPNYFAAERRQYLGYLPTKSESHAADWAVNDLERFKDYWTALGSSAPIPADVAKAIRAAQAWRTMRDATATWEAYVREQYGQAWRVALTYIARLRPLYRIAMASGRVRATEYPNLTALVELPKLVARQSAETKKLARAGAAQGAATTAQAQATAPAPAPSAQPAVTINVKS